MDKIKINLIPQELKDKEKREAKQVLINKISIGLLGVLIITTSSILAVVIFQGATLNSLSQEIEQEKSKVENQREAEAVVNLLKNRIDTINQFSTKRYKQRDVFDLFTKLFPATLAIESIQIDKRPSVTLSGHTDDTSVIKSLFDNLIDPELNEGKITSVSVNSLSRNQLGIISFELNVKLAPGII